MVNLLPLTYFADSCKQTFFGFVPWNNYLTTSAAQGCMITDFHLLGGNSSLLLILLAIIDDLFRLAGLLAVGFVTFAGFQYITSGGSPDKASKALQTIINALIGLGITLVSITFVEFLGQHFGTGSAGSSSLLDLHNLPFSNSFATGSILQTALSVVFGILGAIALLVIVIAGMRYTFSRGDAKTTAEAKAAIIYALVGLGVAILAESIVSFVLR